jgi:Ca2+/Na+ antiporter
MVDGISSVTASGAISVEFVGLILLPIVGNAAEHATAVTVAVKDKMDLAIGVAVGSSMQIALLVIPLTVVVGWILNNNCMNLSFDGFQVAVLFVAVLLVNYLIGDGKRYDYLLSCSALPPVNPRSLLKQNLIRKLLTPMFAVIGSKACFCNVCTCKLPIPLLLVFHTN